ncbi:hypothetical protein [Methylobacterium sp. J-076]|uniref:hypothetical protein n=1 Tax=Methylobacterium sp. J-076 TaxID=2836655 RepID=UPI001FBA8FE6|nr:hypothetical protein [Methylobacterium sp. J-076]MCJ2014741.1 hypothetical protein [Methylobacterium sp. J-076]
MDVVVTPAGSEGTVWNLKDRLGRRLGTIDHSDQEAGFRITPEATGSLNPIQRLHATLDEAMTAIAKHMHGECTLDSQDWD